MLGGEADDNSILRDPVTGNEILGKSSILILDLHIQIFSDRQNAFGLSQVQHGDHLAREEAVIGVAAEPGLKLAGLNCVQLAAAVNELLGDMADFGDVEGDRNGIVAGQDKMELLIGVALQEAAELTEFHGVFFLWSDRNSLCERGLSRSSRRF